MRLNFESVPKDVPLTADNVERLVQRAAELATAYRTRLDKLQAQVNAKRDALAKDTRATIGRADPDDRATVRGVTKRGEARSLSAFRGNIVRASRDERAAILTPLAKVAADAEFLLSLNQSPAQSLGRVGLGEARRTNYQQQLTGAGPVELETAATTAIATADLPLAAALVTVVDRMPRNRRPFEPGDFARRVFGEQHAAVTAKLRRVVHASEAAHAADRQFEAGKADPVSKIALALSKRAIDDAAA